MSLRFIYGRSGSGKTDFIFKEIHSADRPAIIIVPEQYSHTAEARLSKATGIHGPGGVEILSFGRLAWRVLSVHEGAAARHIGSSGKVMLIYKILSQNKRRLSALKSALRERGVPAEISDLISEFKRYGQTPESLHNAAAGAKSQNLKEKLLDLALIYNEYEKAIAESFIDSDDDIARTADVILKNGLFFDHDIYIDRFSSFTPSEYRLIQSLLKASPRLTVTLCMTPNDTKRPEFAPTSITSSRLSALAKEFGVKLEPPVVLNASGKKRPPQLSHLESQFFSYPAEEFTGECANIFLFSAQNPLTEVEYTAREILRLCREEGYMFRDIAVAGRDMEKYSKYIKMVFGECGISCFLDQKTNILNHPVVIFILSALQIIISNFSYESVFTYAKSAFSRLAPQKVDVLENYVLATGLRGGIWKDSERWNVRAAVYSEREELTEEEIEELKVADDVRQRISGPITELEEDLKAGETAAEKCRVFYEFMLRLGLPRRIEAMARIFEKSGRITESTEYRSVFNKVVDTLDSMVDAMGEEKLSIRSFFEILQAGLSEYEIGMIPQSIDGVMVGDVSRIRGYDVRALFLVGVNDGVFPAAPSLGGLLNDTDRNALQDAGIELAPDSITRRIEEEHLIYKTLAMPSEYLFVSFAVADFDGKAYRPSQIVTRLLDLYPGIKYSDDLLGTPDKDKLFSKNSAFFALISALREGNGNAGPVFSEVYEWFNENPAWRERLESAVHHLSYKNAASPLSRETVRSLWPDGLRSAVSRLESFSACPFSYFAKYTLNARERKTQGVNPADAGSFMHAFIDMFSKRLLENGRTWHEVDESYIDEEIEAIMGVLDSRLNKYALQNSPRTARLFTRLLKAMRHSILVIARGITCGEFYPLGYEMTFSENGDFAPLKITLPNGAKVTLTGKIDRADALYHKKRGETFVRIVDYKSGSKSFNLGDVFDGLDLQLAVYLTAVCEQNSNTKPGGMLYFRLDDPVVSANPSAENEEIEAARIEELKLRGLVISDPEIISKMDLSMERASNILPVKFLRDGSPGGSIASELQFKALTKHVKKLVSSLSSRLLGGDTSISPYKKGTDTPCTYCPYGSICGFDLSMPGCKYRRLANKKEREAWELLGREENAD